MSRRSARIVEFLRTIVFIVLVAVCAPGVRAVSLKSVQVWSEPQLDALTGQISWGPSQIYAQTVEARDSVAAGARAPISTWTYIGCYQATGLSATSNGLSPQTCVAACDAQGSSRVAAVQGTACFCLDSGRTELGLKASSDASCQIPCPSDYFEGALRQCGGLSGYYSVYEKYTFVHQTSQGCYDPRRFIWYQSVAIELITYDDETGRATGYDLEWHLHASSINSGEPLFPYHQPLDEMHVGLQYDLDSSRIISYTVPYWGKKPVTERWSPAVRMYSVATLDSTISFTRQSVSFAFDTTEVSQFQLSTGISAVDPLFDIYFVTMPSIPTVPGFDDPRFYTTRLHGINLNTNEDILGGQLLDQSVVLLEVNAQTHELFALLKEESEDPMEEGQFYYVRLGRSYRSNATTSTLAVLFDWTFGAPIVDHVINPYSYQNFVDKVYQVGATAVDHVSNTSFVVMKDSTNSNDPIYIQDINQLGTLRTEDFAPLPSPEVQATWLANTDPIIPLTLPAPKLQSARFTIDGRSIVVQFDAYTVEGALPIDSDGDGLPDGIDWSKRQIGQRNCSDMFARRTAELLGSMPKTYCQWRSGTTIQIHLTAGSTDVSVGTGLFLQDMTIYAYLSEGSQWSMAASGGIAVALPEPLDPPKIVVSWNRYVDLCSSVTLNALESYRHGDQPRWVWFLSGVSCIADREPDEEVNARVRELMQASSVNGLNYPVTGSHLIDFDKDDLEPGCTYTMSLNVTGRWELTSTQHMPVTKQAVPAPKVALQSSRELSTTRARTLTLQAQVENSECETLFTQTQVLKFLWSGDTESENAFSGALEQTPIEDLSLLAPKIATASLLVPKYTLEPEVKYTFRIKVGYESTFDIEGATTVEEASVTVGRSPVKVNIVGGSRKVRKSDLLVIDATMSVDPDFPGDLVEVSPSWSFSYQCTTPEGVPCFPLRSDISNLTDLRECELTQETFTDLGRLYEVPSFSTAELKSDSYYCRHPTKNGLLMVNVPNRNALQTGNYTFTVTGASFGRTSIASLTIAVLPEEMILPEVVLAKLPVAKQVTTQRLKLSGDLSPRDKGQYGDEVQWTWSFFRKEPNPRYSVQAATEAERNNEPYLVPKDTYIEAIELDPDQSETFALTSLVANTLVLRSDTLRPSSTYAFRLTATVPHPLEVGDLVQGYGELEVVTAGPPPVPGDLRVLPEGQSFVEEAKVLSAHSWTAEDTPLTYMFSYRSELSSEFSEPLELRVNPTSAPEQSVWCMKAGSADRNYTIEVSVRAFSLFGASTTLSKEYKVLPSLDIPATNERIRNKAEEVDPETMSLIISCYQLPPPPSPAPTPSPAPGGEVETTSTTTTTLPPLVVNEEEEKQIRAEADALVSLLRERSKSGVVTPASISSNLQATSSIASSGIVTEDLLGFTDELVDSAVTLLPGADSDEERDQVASMVFNTLGAIGVAASNPRGGNGPPPRSTNALNSRTGMSFPASSQKFVEEGVLQLVGIGGSESVRLRRRRLQEELGEQDFMINEGAYPDWQTVPAMLRDPAFVDPKSAIFNETTGEIHQVWLDMFDAQENLEREWLAFTNATVEEAGIIDLERSRDEERFANYTAHLSPEERESVLRNWWEEKARVDSSAQANLFGRSQQTQQLIRQVSAVCSGMLRYMVNREKKEFGFPLGRIRFGRSRDLQVADESFTMKDPKWTLGAESDGSYGWHTVQFTEMNPLAWSPSSPMGPFLVMTLDLYNNDGSHLEVERESVPLDVMTEHSSFASATCMSWDWDADNGLGGWAMSGLMNSENGCSSTHLSIVGMFLDISAPLAELPSAVEVFLEDGVVQYNLFVAIAVCAMLAANGVLHFWGHKQDAADVTKPIEMKKLGDGIRGPRSQDDPVEYGVSGFKQTIGTFWNLARRDHILIACFFRCEKMKVTRLQKASVNFAAIAGTAAVAALLCAKHVVDPRHYIEVGVVAATLTYPMVGALTMLFTVRPISESSRPRSNGASTDCFGPLEALPVPDDEEDESLEGPSPNNSPGMLALAGSPAGPDPSPSAAGSAPLNAPPLPVPGSGAWLGGDAPEAGGGPQTQFVMSGILPPTPPAGPGLPPPPPPKKGSAQLGGSAAGSLPAPPPPPAPPLKSQMGGPSAGGGDGAAGSDLVGFTGKRPGLLPPTPPPKGAPPTGPPSGSRGATPPILPMRGNSPASNLGVLGLPPPPPAPPAPPPWRAQAADAVEEDRFMPLIPGSVPAPALPAPLPPMPPLSAPRASDGDELALVALPRSDDGADATGAGILALPPLPPESASAQVALSLSQAQLLKRVRRMYRERTMQQEAEKVAYDERVDLKSGISHPMARLATAIAHTAVASYWIVASALTAAYAVYFGPTTATRWAYACLCGWAFTWFVLEVVKVALSVIVELSQLSQRKMVTDHSKVKARVLQKTERKKKQMESLSKAQGITPKLHSLLPRPPLPPEPPQSGAWGASSKSVPALPNAPPQPALGDASAG